MVITVALVVLGAATAGYTGFLFAQAKGRVLWMRRGMWAHLILQAGVAGSSCLLLAHSLGLALDSSAHEFMRLSLGVTLALHLLMTLLEGRLAPKNRESEYHRTSQLITRGPYKVSHWGVGVVAGILLPMALLSGGPAALAGVLALVGLWTEKDLLVRAGQALPIS
jgi:protein-S-isoprenylcysteine O-methyltransferase Ste14